MKHIFTITWFNKKDTVTKRIMRHLFCGLACLFLALPAMADSFTIGDLRYTVTNTAERTVTVEAVDRNISGDITIPEKVENDGEEYTVTSIKNYGFGSCSSLTSIKIPNSVTKIGQQAFRACVQLASVNIPNNITIIDYEVFRDCRSLTSVEIPESVITIASEAFYECNELASVSIPNSVTEIRGEAFKLCRNLAVVTIPNSVESIGLNAFYGTNYLLYAGDATGAPWGAAHIAWGTIVDEGFVFADEQKTKLVGYIGSNTNIVTPNTVKSIEEKALTKCNFTSVEISDSVTSIEDNAFTSCGELTSVIIPNSVTHIGVAAFSGCSKLTSIKIPNSITTIENSTFSGCSRLTSIEIPNTVKSIKSGAFQGCEKLNSINIPNSVTEIGSYAFQKCSSLTSIEIPDSITIIQSNTFYMCTSLAKITIPKSVTTIEENAFTSCKASSLFVPEGVTSIGEGAFFNIDTVYYAGNATGSSWGANRHIRGACIDGDFVYADEQKEKLVGYLGSDSIINIPDNVKIIGTNAFEFCTKINSINIPETVTTIEEYAFKGCTGLTEIKLPNSITQIGEGAFYNCTGLTSIGIPNSVISIGNKAFYGCSGMTSITLSNTLTSIGESAFWGCSKLRSIKLPSSLTTIEASLFVGCTNLYNVTIPNTITTIGNSAFSGCSGLTSISIPSSVTSIGAGAFYNCSGLTSITIPNSVTSIGASAFSSCTRLSYVTLSRSITSIEYSTFKQCSKLSSITIPNSVTKIENYAFEDCTTLTYINIPDSVTYIGSNAFNRVKLTSVVIPPSVNYIGESALNGTGVCFYTGNGTCYSTGARRFISKGFLEGNFIYADEQKEKLIAYVGRNTSVTIPNNVKSIEENAFINEKTLTNIIIPNSVTSIGESSFRNCTGLISVTIPKSVISIGWHAFNGCVQLSPFHIPATVDTIGAYAFQGLDTIYYAGTASGSPWSAKKHVKGEFISGDFLYTDEGMTELIHYTGTDSVVTVPDSVTHIDVNTFNGFETVIYKGTATGSPWGAKRHIKGDVFDGDFIYVDEEKTQLVAYLGNDSAVIVPKSVTSIGRNTFNGFETVYYAGTASGSPWSAKKHIKGDIFDGDFVYADEEKTKLVAYLGNDPIVTIPNYVTTITEKTFEDNTTITTVIIPSSVTSIGKRAISDIDTVYYQMETDTICIINNHYIIHDLQEFVTYRDICRKGDGPNARLDADIDLSPVCGIINGEIVNWETIHLGDAMFDGGNHTITNLYINQSTGYVALINGWHIENLIVRNAYVKGTYAAGITSSTSCPFLSNCHFEGVVIGSVFAGGLNLYGKGGILVNCSNYGLVISSGDVKQSYGVGIYAQEPINCYNRGRIVNWEGEAHGIGMYCCDSPTNCYNAGAITAKVAYSIFEAYNNCFNLKIEGVSLINEENIQEMDSSAFLSGAVTDSLNQFVSQNQKTYDWMHSHDSVPLHSWVQGEDGFPRFEGVDLQPTQGYVVRFKGAVNDIEVSRDGTIALPVSPDGYTYIFANDFDGKNIVSDTTVTVAKILNPNFLERDKDEYYLIHNGHELALFRDVVNDGATTINGRLANDIDLSEECKDSVWTPIGIYYKNKEYNYLAFEGIFDGAGHTIEHLYNTITSSGYEGNSHKGLFAYTKNATIKNVVVKNSRITGFSVAAIVANAENTTIVNCGSEAELYGYSDSGVASMCANGEGTNIIMNCYNIGEVKGEWQAYAIAGYAYGTYELKNCYSSALIWNEYDGRGEFGSFHFGTAMNTRCFADTVICNSPEEYPSVTRTSTDYIKSDAFLADMNAWVDSMNAAQSEFVFAHWVRDEVDGYPKLQPTHTSVSLPDVRRATPDGISVYAVDGTIYIRSAHAGKATLYDIHGKAVASVAYAEGITSVDGLQKGVYILCGAKVIVR